MKIFKRSTLILATCALLVYGFIGCSDDSNDNATDDPNEIVAWFNIAIYHGGPDRQIYHVHGR